MDKANYESIIRVMCLHSEFHKRPAMNMERMIERLKEFDRDSLFIVLSKMMLVLHKRGFKSYEGQMWLIQPFLNRQQKKRIRRSRKLRQRLYIHHDMILSLIKLNALHNTPSGYMIESMPERRILFNIILSMNEIYTKEQQPDPPAGADYQDAETFEKLRYSMAKQFLGSNEEDVINQMYRGAIMFDKVNPHLPFDIFEVFKNSTQLTLDEYQQMLFGLMVDWVVETDGKPIEDYTLRSLYAFFEPLGFNLVQIESFEKILAVSPDDFAQVNEDALQSARITTDTYHNYLIFYIKQLIKIGNDVLCISPDFLTIQLTEGPYNIVRRSLNNNGQTANAAALVREWGNAYEEYILERLQNAFGNLVEVKPVDARGNETIDAIVELEHCTLLIEIKYPHWKFSSRDDPTVNNIKEFIGRFASRNKGLGQIKNFYELNSRISLAVNHDLSQKPIIPIMVLGEHFPFDPLNRKILDDYVADNNLNITSDNIFPYIILASDEVEMMESISETYSIDMLEAFIMQYSYAFIMTQEQRLINKPTTFRNIISNNRIQVDNSRALSQNLDDFSDRMLVRFRTNNQ